MLDQKCNRRRNANKHQPAYHRYKCRSEDKQREHAQALNHVQHEKSFLQIIKNLNEDDYTEVEKKIYGVVKIWMDLGT
jgi:hypothetical protein